VAERFANGDLVRTSHLDPPHHTRLPAYARGAVGSVLEPLGCHPLADDRAQGIPTEAERVYTVCFTASELFGEGDHDVMVDVWESKLAPAGEQARP